MISNPCLGRVDLKIKLKVIHGELYMEICIKLTHVKESTAGHAYKKLMYAHRGIDGHPYER